MPIEAANFIHQLDPANPAATDQLADADNHLRMLKAALKATFPNITGAVTATQASLAATVPIGGIIMWAGNHVNVPAGWVLCNGGTFTRSDGAGNVTAPNLLDRFIVGAGQNYAAHMTGGALSGTYGTTFDGSHAHTASMDAQGGHSHGGFTSFHTLSIDEIPSHAHTFIETNSVIVGNVNSTGGATLYHPSTIGRATDSAGGGGSHRHGIALDGSHAHNLVVNAAGGHTHTVTVGDLRPPWYALAFIMKI